MPMKRPDAGGDARPRIASLLLFFFLFLLPASARAGDWRVAPIRLDLGRDAKSGVVTVVNESDERLQVQMAAFEWTQDAEGKDRYDETGDLLFFPRIMILASKEERILRAGIRVPATGMEKTYRLFIEEIPAPRKEEGAKIAVAIRFGVPVFVHPLKEEPRGEVGALTMTAGTLLVPVKNSGNVHFVLQSVLVKGKNGKGEEILSKELSGWYLLAGASRVYTTEIPPEACGNLAGVEIEVRTDKFPIHGKMVADPSMCAK
ncbi:MAG TPA: fimbria/pilus periplasmic chaperone [Candidatus Methylomirabilis sp.]|nr:fimbria/pilus periplasmic chaperone [Candidatus Methylomirabilis sp.]